MDKCPTCEREFRHITDFPLIYVISFLREDIPADVVFKDSDKHEHQGGVYKIVPSTENQRETILRYVNPHLEKLESLVGKEMIPTTLVPDFGQNQYSNIPGTPYTLDIQECRRAQGYRKAVFVINQWVGGSIRTSTMNVPIGRMEYEGRVRH